jgi:hypothetical protein
MKSRHGDPLTKKNQTRNPENELGVPETSIFSALYPRFLPERDFYTGALLS